MKLKSMTNDHISQTVGTDNENNATPVKQLLHHNENIAQHPTSS